jgi:mRNA-degrading endonuclease RelE of RelBE toxin-antitoxin system
MTDKPNVSVIATNPFIDQLKTLKKHYRNIAKDIQKLLVQLESGETPGDQVPGIGFTVYKVRVANRDAKKGKRGGYRVIYYLQTASKIYLLDIYSKTDQADVSVHEIRQLIHTLLPKSDDSTSP